MADPQVPWGVGALESAVSEAAWKKQPSWYLVATDGRMIAPAVQRIMSQRAGATVVECAGSPCRLRVAARGGRCDHRVVCASVCRGLLPLPASEIRRRSMADQFGGHHVSATTCNFHFGVMRRHAARPIRFDRLERQVRHAI
jgi:hypothetical protein